MMQFLAESAIITCMGGLIGIVLGLLGSLRHLLPARAGLQARHQYRDDSPSHRILLSRGHLLRYLPGEEGGAFKPHRSSAEKLIRAGTLPYGKSPDSLQQNVEKCRNFIRQNLSFPLEFCRNLLYHRFSDSSGIHRSVTAYRRFYQRRKNRESLEME